MGERTPSVIKQARLVVLAIAIAAAVGAFMIAKGMMGETRERTVIKQVSSVHVLVARTEIKLGDIVKQENLRWQPWPESAALVGYVQKAQSPKAMSEFMGAVARAPFLAGEPIKAQKLIKASEGGIMAAILPAGMRAIATPIREESAAGGFILPNDRVDVILVRKARTRSGRKMTTSDTLFRNVRVLAIGQNIETKEGKKVVEGKTATLELTPRQSEILVLGRSVGAISLALRSLADANTDGRGPTAGKSLDSKQRKSIRVLRYGVQSRAFGVK